MDTLEADVLRPEVITAAIREAVARLDLPDGERAYEFTGVAVLDRILSGIVLSKSGVAPTGFVEGPLSLP